MKKFRVVFCGTPEISVEIFKALFEINVEVVGVITQPDKPIGRKKIITPSPVKIFAQSKNIEVIQPIKIGEFAEKITSWKPDALITCAYGQIIPQNILSIFKECVNVHGSLLPKYRGGSPIQFAIKNGDKETGITLMQMVRKMDAGKIYVQEKIEIEDKDDSGTLFKKMGKLGNLMIKNNLISILDGINLGEEQNEELATFAYNMIGEQEKINWYQPAKDVVNFIRCMNPKPVAYTLLDGERYKIGAARVVQDSEQYISVMKIFFPGEVITTDKEGIFVQTGDKVIKILQIQKPGKKMVNASTFHGENKGIGLGKWFDPKFTIKNK